MKTRDEAAAAPGDGFGLPLDFGRRLRSGTSQPFPKLGGPIAPVAAGGDGSARWNGFPEIGPDWETEAGDTVFPGASAMMEERVGLLAQAAREAAFNDLAPSLFDRLAVPDHSNESEGSLDAAYDAAREDALVLIAVAELEAGVLARSEETLLRLSRFDSEAEGSLDSGYDGGLEEIIGLISEAFPKPGRAGAIPGSGMGSAACPPFANPEPKPTGARPSPDKAAAEAVDGVPGDPGAAVVVSVPGETAAAQDYAESFGLIIVGGGRDYDLSEAPEAGASEIVAIEGVYSASKAAKGASTAARKAKGASTAARKAKGAASAARKAKGASTALKKAQGRAAASENPQEEAASAPESPQEAASVARKAKGTSMAPKKAKGTVAALKKAQGGASAPKSAQGPAKASKKGKGASAAPKRGKGASAAPKRTRSAAEAA